MAALLIGFALMTALGTGYRFGRRAGTRGKRPWHKRTSRLALGRAAAGLAVLVLARRVQQSTSLRRTVIGGWDALPRRRTARR